MKHSFHKDVTRTLWPLCRLIRLAALPLAGAVIATSVRSADVTGPYFGQTPPGKTPQQLAMPAIDSLPNFLTTRIAFSPDGNECFFSGYDDWNGSTAKLYHTKLVTNVWTSPVLSPFFTPLGYACSHPFFSADGNKLYFSKNSAIWVVDRSSQGWGNPKVLPAPINNSYEGAYSQTTDGTAYFESWRPGGRGGDDVWRISGQPQQAENLGPAVNTSADDGTPFVSPDGSYLLFFSTRAGGREDLFVTFTNGNGGWTAAVNLNQYIPGINTTNTEYAPKSSPDGRYLFFTHLKHATQQGGIYWVANPFSPHLAISNSGANANLSWSTNLLGFVLESTDQLNGPWTPVPGVTGCSATLPVIPETNQFFRLRK
jgi:Tol biopolymer transport system component